ncbi:DUF4097 domain-containing protein [Eubacterium sp. LFL-14]|uniref:DUF4097 domain-containing protein n=1 Tax=Eubacterium album TaxID=2978477 RepID=A0ABT2M074_9FIRM|nr:DUF4097 domain-containing protein [Eubacterium sp. LFL-14]MCT7397613.1 DUF4097 domain-containing protein [Eubacterium sp. LFL-14]
MKKLIKIITIVGVIAVVMGIACTVVGVSRGGSKNFKEEIGKTFAKTKVKFDKKNTKGMTKLQNNSDTIDMLSVNNLRLDLSTASYDIEEWDKEQIGFSYDADIMEVYYLNEGDSLNVLIQYKKKWKKGERDVTVYLPRGKSYSNFNYSLSAGEADIENISAVYATINNDAGSTSIDSLQSASTDITVNMGELSIDNLSTDTMNTDISMGDFDVEGQINGAAKIDCSMGDVSMTLNDGPEAYNYQWDINMADLYVENCIDKSDFSSDGNKDNGAEKMISIECDMGSVEID